MSDAGQNEFTQNRLRQLRGLITVDAWHSKPSDEHRIVDLHAHVNFRYARMGGEDGENVRFRLRLREVELRVAIFGNPPFYIDPARIWRGDGDDRAVLRRLTKTNEKSSASVSGIVGFAIENISLNMKTAGDRAIEWDDQNEVQIEKTIKPISVESDRHIPERPTWVLSPTGYITKDDPKGEFLRGNPWNANEQKLRQLRDVRNDLNWQEISSINLILRCKREDLDFYNLAVRRSDGEWKKTESIAHRITAEENLKHRLMGVGLHAGDMSSDFTAVILGDVYAEPRLDAEFESG